MQNDRSLRIALVLLLAFLSASGAPTLAREVPVKAAAIGKAEEIEAQRSRYLFTLREATYAMGWFPHTARFVPAKDEKMLILSYRVQNESGKTVRFSYRNFTLSALDAEGKRYDTVSEPRASGATEALETMLQPKESIDLYRGLLVPAQARITSVRVQANPGDEPPLDFDLKGHIDPLPGRFSDDGVTIRPGLVAQPGEKVPLGGVDATVGKLTTSQDPLYDGRGPGGGRRWHVLPVEATSRYVDGAVRLRTSTFNQTQLVDRSGERHRPYAAIDDDGELLDVALQAGGIYRARLLYRLPEDLQIEEAVLQLNMPARTEDSLAFTVAVDSRTEVENARDRMVRDQGRVPLIVPGGARAQAGWGRFAPGVYDPEQRSGITIVDATGVGGIPEGADTRRGGEAQVSGGGADGDATNEQPPEDLSHYARDASWAVDAVRGSLNEREGDELYFTLASFTGIQGSNDYRLAVRTVRGRAGSDWLRGDNLVLLDDLSVNWLALPAYTVYGMVIVANEDDRSSQAKLDALEREIEAEMHRRLRRAFAPRELLDPVNASEAVQRSHARGMAWLDANITGDGSAARDLNAVFRDLQGGIMSGAGNDDDYVGTLSAFWINLPTLNANEVLGESGHRDAGSSTLGAGPGPMPPGERWREVQVSFDDASNTFGRTPTALDFRLINSLRGG